MTNLSNPNCLDLENINNETFDELYLLIKIANNLIKPVAKPEFEEQLLVVKKKRVKVVPKPRKQIIFADGLVAMDILMTLSQNVPNDVFFCPTALPAIAKSVLGNYLKVKKKQSSRSNIDTAIGNPASVVAMANPSVALYGGVVQRWTSTAQ